MNIASSIYILLTVLSFAICSLEARQFPSFVKKCTRNDPKLNECIREAIMNAKPYLKVGIKEFSIPSLEPYVLSSVQIQSSWMNATLTDVKVYNAYDIYVDSIDFDLEATEVQLNLVAHFPNNRIVSNYLIDGKLLQFPVRGNGVLETVLNNLYWEVLLTGKKLQKNGKEYLQLTDMSVNLKKYDIDKLELGNLFPGNPELNERINGILNSDVKAYAEEIEPLFVKAVKEVAFSIFKGVFNKFPLDELFD